MSIKSSSIMDRSGFTQRGRVAGDSALMGKLLLLLMYEPENRLWEKTKPQPFFWGVWGGGRQKIVHIEMNT